ncbi:MAG: hypothetical protein Q9N26_04290 [Aquificota bacterium]|nr:hypothetical protein [Aquificota bacterium]
MGMNFHKVHKDVRVHINRGGVDRVLKVGYSIRVNSEERFIEIYREDSVLTQGGSSSRGKFRKVRYTGTPTIRGVYVLLGVEAVGLGGKTAVPLVRLREIDEKGERLTEYLFLPESGELMLSTCGGIELIRKMRPVSSLYEFLAITEEIWSVVGDLRL